MKRRQLNAPLDDIIDFYLSLLEKSERDPLPEMIARFPDFEDDLRECAALLKIDSLIPDQVCSRDESNALEARAASIVENILYVDRNRDHQSNRVDHGSARRRGGLKDVSRSHRHIARAVLSAEVVYQLHNEPTFGRVKHQKVLHLCEYIAEIGEIQGEYRRQAAGPLDNRLIYSVEAELRNQGWFETYERDSFGRAYRPLAKSGQHRKYIDRWWLDKKPAIQKVIDLVRTWNTQSCEIFSTLYAAWNDLIIWGQPTSDEDILVEVLERWNDSKRKIAEARWRKALGWMRESGFSPCGFGRPTIRRRSR